MNKSIIHLNADDSYVLNVTTEESAQKKRDLQTFDEYVVYSNCLLNYGRKKTKICYMKIGQEKQQANKHLTMIKVCSW